MFRKACLTLQVCNKYSLVTCSSIFMVSFLFFFSLFIYLAVAGLCCGMWDLIP